jgi:penicillin-binding protein 1A
MPEWARRLWQNTRRDWQRARERAPGVLYSVTGGLALALAGSVAGLVFSVWSLNSGLPDLDALRRIGDMAEATAVFDSRDKLAFTIFKERRIEVSLDEVSPHMVQAILAIEDQRFYEHQGFDLVRIASAALTNVRRLEIAQGGSTITQQLARQSFLTPDKTVRRKLQELVLAARIERLYSKPDILAMYLNKVYFGDGLYGVEAAARGYFGKHANEVSVAEAATLAGVLKSPSAYAPTVSRERAGARRNLVLRAMLDSGVIDHETWKTARATPIALSDNLRSEEPFGRYFKEQVRREIVERFGYERVYQGGLRVYSTIDMDMQKAAEAAVAEGLNSVETRRKARRRGQEDNADPLQAALIAMVPGTGHVRAMVGGRDFSESSFNRAVQAERQPGSAFKPFVFAAALESGFTAATVINDLNVPIETLEGAWTPEDEHSESDSMSLRAALRMSSNRAAVRLLQDVGIPRTVEYAKHLGVGDVPSVPSLALGSGEVTLQSMTAAYAAFANRGFVPQALLVRRVEDAGGTVLYQADDHLTKAVEETTAFLMASMLADVVNAGTGARARGLGFTLPAAGKTGTTNEFKDAWFVGFTPSLIAGVWVGFDQPRTILARGFASDVAVPVWASFMKTATKGAKAEWLTPPRGITAASVCRLSGKRATEGCGHAEIVAADGTVTRGSTIYTEYFASGTVPTAECDLHRSKGFLAALAGVFGAGEHPTPPPRVENTRVAVVTSPPPERAAPPDQTAQPEPPKKKKRGFWSRVFGVGRDKDRDKGKDQD